MKVEVRIKPDIARRGGGFCDIAGKQNIMLPRDKSGKPAVNHVFSLEATPFVESKIASGELVLVKREGEEKKTLPVFVGDEQVSEITIEKGTAEEEISQIVLMDEKVLEACGDSEIKKFTVSRDRVTIKVK